MKIRITALYEDLTPIKNFLGEPQVKILDNVSPEEYKKMLDDYSLIDSYIERDPDVRGNCCERIKYKFEVL